MRASVLMSIYNETEEEIYASVNSVLEQSFDDFELIVIHDNPTSENRKHIIDGLKNLDSRITVVENSTNIGLAMSMNKAFEIASGEYIIRMDSDDICEPGRFQREIELLETHKWDLVFTNYTVIDSNGNSLKDGKPAIKKIEPNESITSAIIFDGIIHHPTVAMTRNIFIKSGGYRNFPCSQDLDLWLRMIKCGCRFLYLNEPLLKYRIRDNSISGSKRLNQHLTVIYIIRLFAERLKNGSDSYSDQHYKQFIKTRITDHSKKNFDKALNNLKNAHHTDDKMRKIILQVKAFCFCAPLRYSYLYRMTHKNWFQHKCEQANKGMVTIL